MPDEGLNNTALLNNRYRLLAVVAAGGMATIYKAQDTQLNRVVAIKTLRDQFARDPRFVQRFREEAQAAANLNHANIVTVFDVGHDVFNGMDRQYIVMELVPGHDLKQLIRERNAMDTLLSIDTSVDIARQVCEGVGAAHKRGVAHCDIKPQNVIITPDEKAKVTDFGIARAYTSLLSEHSETVWGTPQYYAPEQAAGNPPTAQSDVYSIGIMLFEMLSGRLPFESKDGRELARMHLSKEPPELHRLNPNVSLQLESLVRRALAKDPSSRYKDASQFGKLLAAYLEQGREQTMGRSLGTAPISGESTLHATGQKTAASSTGTSVPSARQIGDLALSQPQRRILGDGAPAAQAAVALQAGRRIGGVGDPQLANTGASQTVSATGATGGTAGATAAEPRTFGNDIFLWLLYALAFICLLGLLPLAYAVVTEYRRPPGALPLTSEAAVSQVTVIAPSSGSAGLNGPGSMISTSSAVFTPIPLTPEAAASPSITPSPTVSVTAIPTPTMTAPNLIGLSVDEAQRRLVPISVSLNVVSEIFDRAVTQVIIGEQRPAPNTALASGGVIEVILRKPIPTQEVPLGLLGLTYDDSIKRTLAGVGWTVVTNESFSTQPERVILGTNPAPGTRLSVSGTLTLTLSSGGRQDIAAHFSDSVYLEYARTSRERYAPGDTINLDVRWRGTGQPQRIYNVAVFLLEGNRYSAQGQADDREPFNNNQLSRTTSWFNGSVTDDSYQIRTRSDLPPGQYRLAIVMYQGGDRLPIINKGRALSVEFTSLVLKTIDIR